MISRIVPNQHYDNVDDIAINMINVICNYVVFSSFGNESMMKPITPL